MLLWPSVVILRHSSSECPRFIIKSLIVYTVLVFLLTDVCCNVCRSGMVLCPARWMKYGFHFAFIFIFLHRYYGSVCCERLYSFPSLILLCKITLWERFVKCLTLV
uniref:Uncharacterized protein n=1 Tax=Rhipicephalus microplus TaxID=6941 RepID=A0A6M2DAD3_RHIMP